jgi:hypothetical protein
MPWSLGWQPPPDPGVIDAVLLAAGKALYLCNRFESKCQDVLRTSHIVEKIQVDPVITLEELFSSLPKAHKTLGETLHDMVQRGNLKVSSDDARAFTKAREARNYIAHKGADIGSLYHLNAEGVLDCLTRLRAAVADLATGDNIVSAWIFEIEEKEAMRPHMMTANYLEVVDLWVFGHLTHGLDDPSWPLVVHQGLPEVPAVTRPTARAFTPLLPDNPAGQARARTIIEAVAATQRANKQARQERK